MTTRSEFHKNVHKLLKRQVFFLRECLQLACENEKLNKENLELNLKFQKYRTKLMILQDKLDELNLKLNPNKKLKP